MEMIYLILGILIGILISILSLIGTYFLFQKTSLQTRLKQVESSLKRKGEIFEPENEDLEEWINNLKSE